MISYAIILLVVGILLVALEAFIPSGGILGFLAAAALVTAVTLAFRENSNTGLIFLMITLIVVPILLVAGLKIFPKTPIGKRLILSPLMESPAQRGADGVSDKDYARFMGKTGKTATQLRPSGIIEIGDERISAVAEGEMIEPNIDVVVIKIEGNSVVVEKRHLS